MPPTVLSTVVEEFDHAIPLLGVCAGHEDAQWRFRALSNDLIEWAMDWILPHEELANISRANAFRLMGKALGRIYKTKDTELRGEIGELLLHIILRKFLNSQRAISRIYFKDAANDTVKGFDAAHIVEIPGDGSDGGLELWLGESKFFKNSSQAIGAVLDELEDHLETQYLRSEFAAISDKIESGWQHADKVKALLRQEISLDEVFERVVIPVFITFDSEVTGRHKRSNQAYRDEITAQMKREWEAFQRRFGKRTMPREVKIHLILLPMATKKDLLDAFDERLKAWQLASMP
ncbi:HamA C-terminal domain-containing protein [Arthrobacter sp. SLBN-122]|uniref:HamA C-terminal domain-containing protein n=1 Tax=Arthrobacter sp. SLBN-122 TaxID=2768455 RepID=UPI001150A0CD|nr:DUF1837 domain-containing protein [Arthrobacter sp. SLBN-122]TQJ35757.1 uncharacterized protein DUF1837 [Arthrobacter sp. SLBN-122]